MTRICSCYAIKGGREVVTTTTLFAGSRCGFLHWIAEDLKKKRKYAFTEIPSEDKMASRRNVGTPVAFSQDGVPVKAYFRFCFKLSAFQCKKPHPDPINIV